MIRIRVGRKCHVGGVFSPGMRETRSSLTLSLRAQEALARMMRSQGDEFRAAWLEFQEKNAAMLAASAREMQSGYRPSWRAHLRLPSWRRS